MDDRPYRNAGQARFRYYLCSFALEVVRPIGRAALRRSSGRTSGRTSAVAGRLFDAPNTRPE